jgi:hypothetical protein
MVAANISGWFSQSSTLNIHIKSKQTSIRPSVFMDKPNQLIVKQVLLCSLL